MRTLLSVAVQSACALSLLGVARAQQFQQVTAFPGTAAYSEGVECADVDHDGDLDVIVADGSGSAIQNKIFINKLVETGTPWVLADESVARFGAHASVAKYVTTGDVNGDGWVDVLFANTGNSLPSLYINQGAANPGFFTFQTPAQSGLSATLSAGGACFGDVDDDGDLDLVINDAYNTAPAKPLHLYINDGTGHFTEQPTWLNSPLRSGQMDVQLADVDNNWTIDVFGIDKASFPAHFLLLNDGTAHFTDHSSLITTASGNSYEAEIGDLDGDNDLDLFFVSLNGFAEGAVKNNLVPGGTLTFTNQSNLGGDDDNEITLFDYDNDGDYDILVGSLGSTEKFWRNDGNFNFVAQNSIIQAQADSTLDCTAADLNNDGKYDVITVQGESGNFTNKFYRNTGSADTIPPVLVGIDAPTTAISGAGAVVHAKVRDQVLDDGVNYVTASADYVVLTTPSNAGIAMNAGAFSPSSLTITPGTQVTFTNSSGSAQNVVGTSAPYTFDSGSIANGGTYQRVFVNPGTYNFTSVPGGFTGTITVSGLATHIDATYMGGQQYRFRFDDNAGGAGVQLCYELRFRDWPGNVRVSDGACIALSGSGTPFCFGDGSGTPCPCGNNAPLGSGTGCLSSLGIGGLLGSTGTPSLSNDTVVLHGSSLPANGSVLYFEGTTQVAGGLGGAFGDGLRCAGGSVVRLGTKMNTAGTSQFPGAGDPSLSVKGQVTSPGTRQYQAWYRNAAAFCQPETYNLTNGLTIVWNL
jgi:plastocyanin